MTKHVKKNALANTQCDWRKLNIIRKCVDMYSTCFGRGVYGCAPDSNYGKFNTNNKFMPLHSIKFHYFRNPRTLCYFRWLMGLKSLTRAQIDVVSGDKCATLIKLYSKIRLEISTKLQKFKRQTWRRVARHPGSKRMFIALLIAVVTFVYSQ